MPLEHHITITMFFKTSIIEQTQTELCLIQLFSSAFFVNLSSDHPYSYVY